PPGLSDRHLERPDLLGNAYCLFLVIRDEWPVDGDFHSLGEHLQVVKGLGRDLAERLTGYDTPGTLFTCDLLRDSVHPALAEEAGILLKSPLFQLGFRTCKVGIMDDDEFHSRLVALKDG